MMMALFRAKKKEATKVGSGEENLKSAFEEFEKTEGVEFNCIKVTGKRYGSKLKFNQWSESEVRKLVELGYRWSSDEWVKDHPEGLYNEFKNVEKLLGGGVGFRISCKRADGRIFQASVKVQHAGPPTKIGFHFQQSELAQIVLDEKKRREQRGF